MLLQIMEKSNSLCVYGVLVLKVFSGATHNEEVSLAVSIWGDSSHGLLYNRCYITAGLQQVPYYGWFITAGTKLLLLFDSSFHNSFCPYDVTLNSSDRRVSAPSFRNFENKATERCKFPTFFLMQGSPLVDFHRI